MWAVPYLSLAGILFCALGIGQSFASDAPGEVKDAMSSLERCYMSHAKDDGSKSCLPPPTLVGSVFGACGTEEMAFKNAIRNAYSADAELADRQLEIAHGKSTDAIQDIILTAQSKIRKCP